MLWPTPQNYLPSNEDQVQLRAESLWPHPNPTQMGQKEDAGEEKLPQGPQVQLLRENPREKKGGGGFQVQQTAGVTTTKIRPHASRLH